MQNGNKFSVPPFTQLCKGHLPFDEELGLNFWKFLVMIATEFSENLFLEKRTTSQGTLSKFLNGTRCDCFLFWKFNSFVIFWKIFPGIWSVIVVPFVTIRKCSTFSMY